MIKVRDLTIGSGRPKISVPLTARNGAGIYAQAKSTAASGADICEFRADFFDDDFMATLPRLRDELGDIPLLFTLRTMEDCGEREVSVGEYSEICAKAIQSGMIDMIDVQLSMGEDVCRELTALARRAGVATILSSHDFIKTPPKQDMLKTLETAREYGADIAKLAVMPKTALDVLALLETTAEFTRQNPHYTVITMSMGALGKLSRVCGELVGSAVTFAALDRASAPGQFHVTKLRPTLELLSLE